MLIRYQQGQGPPGQQQGYGGPPPQQGQQPPYGQQQGQYGGAPPQAGGGHSAGNYKEFLNRYVRDNGLLHIYPENCPQINQIANVAGPKVDAICQRWRLPREVGQEIIELAFYDIILLVTKDRIELGELKLTSYFKLQVYR